nr:hypothetical protein [Tanacetum cinerariifolium]
MSSASSAVTYTSVYTDSEPGRVFWGADEELSDRGSPRVIVYVYDGLPMQPVAPPSPDYIPGPEEPQTPLVSQDEDEHEPMYPEYIPIEDEQCFQLRSIHYLLLIHLLLSHQDMLQSHPKEDPEEYKDDKSDGGPVDYPMDGGDDGDDDDGDSSKDDTDDKDEGEEEYEEEHLALAESVVVIPTVELVSPPSSPLTSLSPPSAGERLARMASTQALIDAVTAVLRSSPLPPPLYLPLSVDRRDDVPETEMLPRKRLCFSTLNSRYKIGESFTARSTGGREIDYGFVSTLDAETRRRRIGEVGYGIRATWVDPTEAVPEIAPITLGEDSRTRISQRVTIDSQRVDLLIKDMIAHQETILIMEEEAYAAQEAWAHLIGLSQVVVRNLRALIYCRDRDTITLRELIDSDGKLIPEDPQSGIPRLGIPRPPRASMQDLYDRIGKMKIRQEAIEQIEYRQSYHWDKYQGVFEHMAEVYSVPLQRAHNPPG